MRNAGILILVLLTQVIFGQNTISFIDAPFKSDAIELKPHKSPQQIPFKIENGMIFVEAEMDGKIGNFVLDTGAPAMIVNSNKRGKKIQKARSVAQNFDIHSTTISSFKWANIKSNNLDAYALDLSHLEKASNKKILGMIGFNVLKNHEILIDYEQEQLFLYPPKKNIIHRTADPMMTLNFELQDHLPVIEVLIGGQLYRFGLDTGAESNLIHQKYAESIPEEFVATIKMGEIQGLDQKIIPVKSATIKNTIIKGTDYGAMPYLFMDLSHLQSDTNLAIDGLLGGPFFQKAQISINFAKRKVYIWNLR